MYSREQSRGFTHTLIGRVTVLVVSAVAIFIPGWAAQGQTSSEPSSSAPQSSPTQLHTHMSEPLRSSVKKVVVIAGESPSNQEITGTYDKETAGLLGGMNEGSRIGNIPTEIGGVAVNIPIPILTIPGAIYGGLSGRAKSSQVRLTPQRAWVNR